MRVLVCGGRNIPKLAAERALLRELRELVETHGRDEVIVIHGDCLGADLIADRVARALELWVWPCPAAWSRYGGAAGPRRNLRMLAQARPELVIALPGGKGTEHMCKSAAFKKVPVKRVALVSP